MRLSLLSIASKPLPTLRPVLKAVSDPTTVVKVKVLAGTDTAARPVMTLVSKASLTKKTDLFLLYLFFFLNDKN